MKLAEALLLRGDYQNKMEQIKERISSNVLIQEGDKPNENPIELIREYEGILKEYEKLVIRINNTNNLTKFNEEISLSEALVKRDVLSKKSRIYKNAVEDASIRQERYTRSEVKYISTINIKEYQNKIDEISKEYRILDTKIQGLNWTIDLI
ncbi:DIP1984 family protein [Peptoniphilus stercorisuis]|uniref:Septicolysin n=1 Tax=Peptoniphilus stercorisuis TaxID=1436965 RepID=A0ABS4KE90_9FIRM|nr:DIP1984 family protein [Peptoniphilus stercorisuis]MBP2025710.1 hypothetical protein [Peptoniphilus stercorisuis]